MHTVNLDKGTDSIGREAPLRQPEQGPVKRLGHFVLDDPEAVADIRAALRRLASEFTNGDAPGVRLRKKR